MILSAFLMLGFLVGNLVGLTAESVVSVLIPLLFAFGGGSAIGFFHKLDSASRQVASKAIFAFSVACLIGIYIGILVSEHQLLTPKSRQEARADASISDSKYLRSYVISKADQIDQLKATGALTPEEAYEALYSLVSEKEDKK